MTCASAEEVRARLALRALWTPAQASTSTQSNEDSEPTTSSFHRQLRAEFDDVLKSGFNRRLGRLERTVNRFLEAGSNGNGNAETIEPNGTTNGSSTSPTSHASVSEMEIQTSSSGSQDYWVEDRKRGSDLPSTKFSEAYTKAFNHAVKSTWPVQKKWGPSRRQNNFEDPPYKEEKLEREITTIRSTLQCVNQNLVNRERQIIEMKRQLADCQVYVKEEEVKIAKLEETLTLAKDPKQWQSVHEARLEHQKQSYEQLTQDLVSAKSEAKRYHNLAKQQHAFFIQAEVIYCQEHAERVKRFPAGEVFLVPQPLPMDDEKAESWDVGTAVANPYTVDSWPFEANVLARRCPKECPMDNVTEETLEDLMECNRPGRTNPFRGPGLSLSGLDQGDDYEGPSTTSRSL